LRYSTKASSGCRHAQHIHDAPYRYYSPTTARRLTRDPLGTVDGPNVYAYVSARPLTFPDWAGLAGKCAEQLKSCVAQAVKWRNRARRSVQKTWLACHASISVACAVECAPFCVGTLGLGCALCVAGCKAAQAAFCNLTRSRAFRRIERHFGQMLDECREQYDRCKESEPCEESCH